MDIMFMKIPVFTISEILTSLILETIAFGGVPIGNIKAKEEQTPTVNIKRNGFIPKFFANIKNIGMKVEAKAVLDINSVRNTDIVVTMRITIKKPFEKIGNKSTMN